MIITKEYKVSVKYQNRNIYVIYNIDNKRIHIGAVLYLKRDIAKLVDLEQVQTATQDEISNINPEILAQ